MKSMIFSCKFLRVCALPVPAEGDSSAGRALSPASVRSEPAWSTDGALDDGDHDDGGFDDGDHDEDGLHQDGGLDDGDHDEDDLEEGGLEKW